MVLHTGAQYHQLRTAAHHDPRPCQVLPNDYGKPHPCMRPAWLSPFRVSNMQAHCCAQWIVNYVWSFQRGRHPKHNKCIRQALQLMKQVINPPLGVHQQNTSHAKRRGLLELRWVPGHDFSWIWHCCLNNISSLSRICTGNLIFNNLHPLSPKVSFHDLQHSAQKEPSAEVWAKPTWMKRKHRHKY